MLIYIEGEHFCDFYKKGEFNGMEKKEMPAYGKLVKHRLIELNMSQVELAEIVGSSKQYLHKILAGERSGATYIEKINQVLGI